MIIKKLWLDEKGMGIIEVAIIIVIVIGVALIFRSEISELINNIFDKISIDINAL